MNDIDEITLVKNELPVVNVEFDSTIFFAGKRVSGNVIIALKECNEILSMVVRLVGKAHAESIIDDESETKEKSSKFCEDLLLVFMEVVLNLSEARTDPNANSFVNSIPFHFTLPSNCPSSFEEQNNFIHYSCQVIVRLSGGSAEYCARQFQVIGACDTKLNETVLLPANATENRKFLFFCCSQGTFHGQITIPRSIFMFGEYIPLTMQISNDSSKTINEITLQLVQNFSFISKTEIGSRQLHSRLIDSVGTYVDGPIKPKQKFVSDNKRIYIPQDIPPTITVTNCPIMEIVYELQIVIKPKGHKISMKSLLPIYILPSSCYGLKLAIPESSLKSVPSLIPLPQLPEKACCRTQKSCAVCLTDFS